jgi:hypothetical protein
LQKRFDQMIPFVRIAVGHKLAHALRFARRTVQIGRAHALEECELFRLEAVRRAGIDPAVMPRPPS